MTTLAPRCWNQLASGTQALRVGSITTVSSASSGNDDHSDVRSLGVVRNFLALQRNSPRSLVSVPWWAARQATSIPSMYFVIAVLSLSLNLTDSSDEEEPHRTFTNRDPNTNAGRRVLNRACLPRRCSYPPREQQARSRAQHTLRSVSIGNGQAPGTLNSHAAGRTV